jgi:lipopolysaccharide export system permease protein
MRLIERYIFGRMLGAAALCFLALATMLWMALALRQFELVTNQGQSLWTFLNVSSYLLPFLVMIVLPVSVLIAVIYTFSTLNGDSELAVINASGASQVAMLKPAALLGAITAVIVGAMSIYFTPLTLRLGQALIAQVRSNIVNSIVREGAFVSLATGLTFHIQGRLPDGSFRGVFVSDDRDAEQTITYLAERGAVIDNPLGVFLIMGDGTIQQRSKIDQRISMIEFSSYAFDLSTFASRGAVSAIPPREQPTAYLLDPDPDDPVFRQFPEQFVTELHDRLATPLYGFVFAFLPLAFLGQAQSPRDSRAASIAFAVVGAVLIRGAGFLAAHAVRSNTAAIALLYAIPAVSTALIVALVLKGVQLRPPRRLRAWGDAVVARLVGILRGPSEAPVGGAG